MLQYHTDFGYISQSETHNLTSQQIKEMVEELNKLRKDVQVR